MLVAHSIIGRNLSGKLLWALAMWLSAGLVIGDEPKPNGETPEPRELKGQVVRFVRSPKGSMEGMLLRQGEAMFQATFPNQHAALMTAAVKPGDTISVAAIDDEPRGYWLVVKVQSLTDARGKQLVIPPKPEKPKDEGDVKENPQPAEKPKTSTLAGEIKWLNYAKHGEVNGVVLSNGGFIHLHPDGAQTLGVKVGQQITATGVATTAPDGIQVLEHPVTVNGKPAPHKHEEHAEVEKP